LGPRAKRYFDLIHGVMGVAVCGTLCWYGAVVTWGQYQRGVVDIQVVDMPKYLILVIIPLAFFFLAAQFARRFFIALKGIRGSQGPSTGESGSQVHPNV
jgi:TRAP-type C4-dicarboxylate transport system permease small subunit